MIKGMHLGTPCTFSRLRGACQGPARSTEFPSGLPQLASDRGRKLVEQGNVLMKANRVLLQACMRPQVMLRNRVSGPKIGLPGLGRILGGQKNQNRPSGRPNACRTVEFEVFPITARPNPARKPDFRPENIIA